MLYDYLNKISLEDIHQTRQLQIESEQQSPGTQAA